MEQKPSLEMVYMAVSALYNNPNAAEKERASQWLGELQKSVHAWTVADELLHHKRDLESCYFAAQTMRSKIHQSFHELPAEVHGSLRDSLLDHLGQINDATSTVIVTQLSLALADLALQMTSWRRPVIDLINRFSGGGHLWPLLEIMTVLPEELEVRSVRLGENRRLEVLEDLKTCASTVNEFLKHCCNNCSDNYHENIPINVKILRCLTSWVSVGAIPLTEVLDNIVVQRAFAILNVKAESDKAVASSLHEAATDCVCTLLQCLEDNNNQQALENYLFNSVLNLEVAYHMSVANEDQEKSINYCRIFTELGESFLEKIITHSNDNSQHYALKVLDLILICVGHHDYEVAEITFNLWYLLSEELYSKNTKSLTVMFRPYIERLITALCRHCQMEPDHEGLLDDGDDFKDFRLKVSDLIRDVVFVVGSANCFRQMFVNLQMPGVTWDSSEAALFVMQAVAKKMPPTENEIVPKVVEAILNLPQTTHIAFRYTAVLLLGELCEWVERHPEYLDPILNFLVTCLPQPGIGAAAAASLQSISTMCNEHMPRHVPILLQLLRQVDTCAITNGAVIGLLSGVANIVQCVPHGDMTAALRELCSLQIAPLCELMERDAVPIRGTKTDPVLWLDRLAAVFRGVNVRLAEGEMNPCRTVVIEVWPVLSRAFEKYQNDLRIMERCCRALRFTLRCVSQQVGELLEPIVLQIKQLYVIHKHSCYLYIGSILVDEYASDPACVPILLDMLDAFIHPTFQLLQEEDGLRNHPDTVDDFFRLCARFIQRAPVAFLQCAALPHIIQCALLACSLDHKEANTSVMKFFYDLIGAGQCGKLQPDYGVRKVLVERILKEYRQQLVTNLLHACVFYLHTYMLSEVADVIVELLHADRESTAECLANSLETLPKQGNGGVISVTPQQLSDFHATITRSETSKDVTYALKDLTRLYR